MTRITIEQITLPMKKDELLRWKQRDSTIVPEFALNWKGNGVSNGYGFGEWNAEKYFRSQGYYLINDEFDFFSKTSKYERYNEIISSMIGKEKIDMFKSYARKLYEAGLQLENLDLFVFNLETFFFAEVKKEKDFLRPPQIRFMYLAKEILHTKSKVVYLSENASSVSNKLISYEIDISLNIEKL